MKHENVQIRLELEFGELFQELLQSHLQIAAHQSPPGSVHALGLDALKEDAVTVWTAWDGEALLGCGALKQLSVTSGEIKSMHTAANHRMRGVAASLLDEITARAKQRGYDTLWLETGSTEEFAPAQALYKKFGFKICGPFGSYKKDPFSLFMMLKI